jgi:septal ring factor EnvC (AmiA/AmiB activator)
MSQPIDRQVLADQIRLREKELAKIERQFKRLDEKLTALESELPVLDEQFPTESIRHRKPR